MSNPLIRLHGFVSFDRSAKVRWLLTELKLPFENRWLNPEKKENESPEFLKLNPSGRIPVLEIGDTAIHESGAICAYLGDQYLDQGFAPALSSPDRAKYQQWMYFAASTLEPLQTRIMIIEDIPAGDFHDEKEASLVADLSGALAALDQGLSKNSFLIADKFSIADICVSYHLYWLTLWPELNVAFEKYPRVSSYLDRLRKMPTAVQAKAFSYPE